MARPARMPARACRCLVLAHPRRMTQLRFAVDLAHAELKVVQIRGFGQIRVVLLFDTHVVGLGQEQEKAADQIRGEPRIWR